jgi:hypothetical protein
MCFEREGLFSRGSFKPCGERASLAVMPRLIVLPQEANGKALGPNSRVLFLRRKGAACCKSANVRQVLLKFILGPAFLLFLQSRQVPLY